MKTDAKKRHAYMVEDELRTSPLISAITKTVKKGDVVVDIGTGTGILAIAAAKAGAKIVYAIDCDARALDVAKAEARKNGVDGKILFIETISLELKLNSPADVIICETVGSFAFDENILSTLSDAKKRSLKRGGKIIPATLELWAAALKKLPKVDMPAEIAVVDKNNMVSKPVLISAVNFNKPFKDAVHVKKTFTANSNCTVKAFAMWPKVIWTKGFETDASPFKKVTHWKQGILPIEERSVKKNEKFSIEFIIGPHPDEPRMMTERLWRWI